MLTAGARMFFFVVCIAAFAAAQPTFSPSSCEVQHGVHLMSTYGECVNVQLNKNQMLETLSENWNMDGIRNFVQVLCTQAIPEATRCNEDRYSNCSATVRELVSNTTATGVGFLCQPGGAGPVPEVTTVLNSISNADLSGACAGDSYKTDQCDGRLRLSMDKLETMPLQSMKTLFQNSLKDYILCWAQKYKQMKSTCPRWKGALLQRIGMYLIIPIPGTRLPFTEQEVDNLFEVRDNLYHARGYRGPSTTELVHTRCCQIVPF